MGEGEVRRWWVSCRKQSRTAMLKWCRVDCGVVWCGVVYCGVVWCGVAWFIVVWCGVV